MYRAVGGIQCANLKVGGDSSAFRPPFHSHCMIMQVYTGNANFPSIQAYYMIACIIDMYSPVFTICIHGYEAQQSLCISGDTY